MAPTANGREVAASWCRALKAAGTLAFTVTPTWAFLADFRAPAPVLALPSWDALVSFRAPRDPTPSWAELGPLIRQHATLEQVDIVRLAAELQRWEAKLAYCGGDPSSGQWHAFRPLRTDREEDWSDWLQHLMVTSRGGRLTRSLLGPSWRSAPADVHREVSVDARRADLVLKGQGSLRAQIEVKVGDRAFAKTADTAALLEAADPGTWSHVLLLPPWDAPQARQELAGMRAISVRTWDEVAGALRVSLWRMEEDVSWSVWARAFCGAIEQRILELPDARGHGPSGTAELATHMSNAARIAEESP